MRVDWEGEGVGLAGQISLFSYSYVKGKVISGQSG